MMMKQILLAGVLGLLAHSVRAGSAIGKMNISSLGLYPNIAISYNYTYARTMDNRKHVDNIKKQIQNAIKERIDQVQGMQRRNTSDDGSDHNKLLGSIHGRMSRDLKGIKARVGNANYNFGDFTAHVCVQTPKGYTFQANDEVLLTDGKNIMDSTVYTISSTDESPDKSHAVLVQRNPRPDVEIENYGVMHNSKVVLLKRYGGVHKALQTLAEEYAKKQERRKNRKQQRKGNEAIRAFRKRHEDADKARAARREREAEQKRLAEERKTAAAEEAERKSEAEAQKRQQMRDRLNEKKRKDDATAAALKQKRDQATKMWNQERLNNQPFTKIQELARTHMAKTLAAPGNRALIFNETKLRKTLKECLDKQDLWA